MNRDDLKKKVPILSGQFIDSKGWVSSIDLLIALGWLTQKDLLNWRRGRVPYLEKAVSVNLSKISFAMKTFRSWAKHSKLKPSQTVYKKKGHFLRFSKNGISNIERAYQTHFFHTSKIRKINNSSS